MSRLEGVKEDQSKGQEINNSFPEEHLYKVHEVAGLETPWFADFANYLSGKFLPKGFKLILAKEEIFHRFENYFWEDPHLFKVCANQMVRRCVPRDEGYKILEHYHSGPTGAIMLKTDSREGFGFKALLADDLSGCSQFCVEM